jgi:hypothetical protein
VFSKTIYVNRLVWDTKFHIHIKQRHSYAYFNLVISINDTGRQIWTEQ